MCKHRLASVLSLLIMFCLLLTPQIATAQLLAGVELGYGKTSYSTILDTKNITTSEWSAGIWANYTHEDLLFAGLYQGSLGVQDFQSNRSLAHIGANYLFLEEDLLRIYGGLGYQLVSTRLNTPEIDSGNINTFTGHGFTGQVVVDIAITDDLKTSATLVAVPWTKWSHNVDKITTADIDSGHTFIYKLEIGYDFSTDFGVQVSILGNSYKVPDFTRNQTEVGGAKSSSTSVNLGLTRHF